jgi:hypothetical protein
VELVTLSMSDTSISCALWTLVTVTASDACEPPTLALPTTSASEGNSLLLSRNVCTLSRVTFCWLTTKSTTTESSAEVRVVICTEPSDAFMPVVTVVVKLRR